LHPFDPSAYIKVGTDPNKFREPLGAVKSVVSSSDILNLDAGSDDDDLVSLASAAGSTAALSVSASSTPFLPVPKGSPSVVAGKRLPPAPNPSTALPNAIVGAHQPPHGSNIAEFYRAAFLSHCCATDSWCGIVYSISPIAFPPWESGSRPGLLFCNGECKGGSP